MVGSLIHPNLNILPNELNHTDDLGLCVVVERRLQRVATVNLKTWLQPPTSVYEG